MTDQKDIVNHALYCMKEYPTIENNIPKEKMQYDSSLQSFAIVDNKLASSQGVIGSSSNLAQVCQSYTYTFDDKKYSDYICILSVLAQAAIDSSKKVFDIDLNEEIDIIKKENPHIQLNQVEH